MRKSKKHHNTFETPDFAFPQTVIDNATVHLQPSSSDLDVVRAAMQIVTARQIISRQSAAECIATLDSIAEARPGAVAAILHSLEAGFLQEIFEDSRWIYNNRKMPLTQPFPENPEEWSGDMFAMRVLELCHSSLSDEQLLKSTPIAYWEPILTDCEPKNSQICPNLYTLLMARSVEILSEFLYSVSYNQVIPFFGEDESTFTPAQKCYLQSEKYLDDLIQYGQDLQNPTLTGYAISRLSSGKCENLTEFVNRQIGFAEQMRTHADVGEIYYALLCLCDERTEKDNSLLRKLMDSLSVAVSEHPDYYRNGVFNTKLAELKRTEVSFRVAGTVRSDRNVLSQVRYKNVAAPLYVQLLALPNDVDYNYRQIKLGKVGRFIASRPIPQQKEYLSEDTVTLDFGQLPYGRYCLVVSESPTYVRSKFVDNGWDAEFRVSDLSAYCSWPNCFSEPMPSGRIYALESSNGKPLPGVSVVTVDGPKSSQQTRFTTGQGGFVDLPGNPGGRHGCDFILSRGADQFQNYLYTSSSRSESKESVECSLFTDLSIYHPGDTVHFSAILYKKLAENKGFTPAPNKKFSAVLENASGEEIDTLSLTSDQFGRCSAEFTLPRTGMLGRFKICAVIEEQRFYSRVYFQVAEYVQPTFFVEVESEKPAYNLGEQIVLSGRAVTYSGMPLAGAEINLTLNGEPSFFRFFSGKLGSYSKKLATDEKGCFSITLPTDSLRGTVYENFLFAARAVATSPAGESQSSNDALFSLGNISSFSLINSSNLKVGSDNKVELLFSVSGVADPQKSVEADYRICEVSTGSIVAQGSFSTPRLSLDCGAIPSGRYKVEVKEVNRQWPDKEITDLSDSGEEEDGNTNVNHENEFVIYRSDDKLPPITTPLWVPKTYFVAARNASNVEITVGSSYPSYIIYSVATPSQILEEKTIFIDSVNRQLSVPAPSGNEPIYVSFFAMRDGQPLTSSVIIVSEISEKKLTPEVVTFRDKISASGHETWQFRFTFDGQPQASIPVLATMSNQALNALAPFSWKFNPRLSFTSPLYQGCFSIRSDSGRATLGDISASWVDLCFPALQSLYSSGYGRPVLCYSMNSTRRSRNAVYDMDDAVEYDCAEAAPESSEGATQMKLSKVEPSAERESESAGASDSGQESFRPAECPLAFFMPSLVTDAQGNIEISFDVPNFNTTWQLQLLAYNLQMQASVSEYLSVASKPVMIQSTLPRFLRTSDSAVFRFTAFNNSSEAAPITVDVEIFDPISGSVISKRTIDAGIVAPQASAVVPFAFDADSRYEFVGVRAMARMGRYADGEQSLLAILPSSAPVTESYPFYLAPDQTSFTLEIPKYGDDTPRLSFSYCDNPVWYCLTALPDMTFNPDATILGRLRQLYGNSLAAKLVDSNPRLSRALKLWTDEGDSTLISPLSKDEELKIVELGNTPWTLNAEAETMRMRRLVRLTDTESNSKAIKDAIDEIAKRQLPSGGWAWCEGMKASPYITGRVLLYFSMMRRLNAIEFTSRENEMIRNAVRYCDAELYNDYIESKKTFSVTTMLNYLYIRQEFPEVEASPGFASLRALALKAIKNNWREFGIYDASTAAVVLFREGYPMKARTILESLRQKAMKSPERGVWFDNLSSSWFGRNKLITTMQALQAFDMVTPDAPEIDGLRQWLVIQRQTEDWGTADEIAEVVFTILTTGSDLTGDYAPATFRLGDKEFTPSHRDLLTGSFTVSLSPEEAPAGSLLTIEKSAGHQAWGGFMARYIAPITSVKEFSEGDLQIRKRILKISTEPSGAISYSELKPGDILSSGDKVAVELTLIAQRDMDYVAVTDSRSATLEPADQISKYVWQQGASFYREVRNESTNLFFDFLPKGTTQVMYECYVATEGDFTLGIADMQSLYAPMQSAHSAGALLKVKGK